MNTNSNTPEKFWSHVDKTAECWTWTGYIDQTGYGSISWKGKPVQAHRLAWFLTYGDIPNGLFVLHKCDNPKCANPNHLFLGTNADNQRDKVNKGRQARGETMHTAKLKTQDVILIRKQYHEDRRTQTQIAKDFGMCQSTIERIVNGKYWRHI